MQNNADAFVRAIVHVLLFIVVHGARKNASLRKPRKPKPSFKRKEVL